MWDFIKGLLSKGAEPMSSNSEIEVDLSPNLCVLAQRVWPEGETVHDVEIVYGEFEDQGITYGGYGICKSDKGKAYLDGFVACHLSLEANYREVMRRQNSEVDQAFANANQDEILRRAA